LGDHIQDKFPIKISLPRRFDDYVLLLLALGLGGYAVIRLRQPWAKESSGEWLWWLLLAAGLLGGYALRRMGDWLPDAHPSARPADERSSSLQVRGLYCLLGAVVLTAWIVWRLWPTYYQWNGTVWPWLLAMALILLGGGLLGNIGQPAVDEWLGRATQAEKRQTSALIPIWLEVTAFLLIFALAIFLRLYRLNSIPAGIYVDETNGALDALNILDGRNDSPFATGWYETPNGYIYYMAALFKLLGANYYALKVASLIPAILTIPAVYVLGRLLFGSTAGLCAMLFIAVSRWHLTMSRWGWNEIAPPLFQVLATFFLIRGLRERRAWDYALGGLISGLMVYTYLSSRLALATLGLFAVYWLLSDPEGPLSSWKRHGRGLMLFLLACLIAVAPISVTYITRPFTFFNRVSEISIFNDMRKAGSYQPLVENIWRHVKLFYQTGDPTGRQNIPGEPQTDPVTAVLMTVGLGYAFFHLRDRRRGLLWLWLVLAMAGGYLSEVRIDSPNSYRTLTAVPAVALLVGDTLDRLARGLYELTGPSLSARQGLLRASLAGLVLVGGGAGAAFMETWVYFGPQANSVSVQASFNLTETAVAKQVVAAYQTDTPVYLSPRFYYFSPLRFLVHGAIQEKTGRYMLNEPPYHLARPEEDLPIPNAGSDALFLLDDYYRSVMDYFRSFYPDAQAETVLGLSNIPLYFRVRVPQSDLAAIQGLDARFTHADGTVEQRVVANIDEDWQQQDVTSAEWTGSLRLEHSGTYDLVGQGSLQVSVDGQPWSGRRFLCSGLHTLRVTQSDSKAQSLARLKWTLPDGSGAMIPVQAFFRVRVPTQGLTGYYYANQDWQGEPLCKKTTPFFLLSWPEQEPVQGPFSARFVGALRVTQPGKYHFVIHADDGARLSLDGKVIAEGLIPDQPNDLELDESLTAGDHPIQLDYFQRGGGSTLEFYWQSPDGPQVPVPPSALIPVDTPDSP